MWHGILSGPSGMHGANPHCLPTLCDFKLYMGVGLTQPPLPSELVEDDHEKTVEPVLNHRTAVSGGKQCKIEP